MCGESCDKSNFSFLQRGSFYYSHTKLESHYVHKPLYFRLTSATLHTCKQKTIKISSITLPLPRVQKQEAWAAVKAEIGTSTWVTALSSHVAALLRSGGTKTDAISAVNYIILQQANPWNCSGVVLGMFVMFRRNVYVNICVFGWKACANADKRKMRMLEEVPSLWLVLK